MTPDRAALLARIEAFDADGPATPALPFAARLAREHGWSRGYAERVVREYKRFAFLAAAGDGPVCPSEAVDAAWHLHLTYTRSYWQRFCGEALGRPLHHEPTRGGPAEARKHLAMYEHTLAAYREAFGEPPPADVWPPAGERFGDDLRHRVVNTARNWVVPKRPVVRAAQFAAGLAAVAVLVPGCEGGGLNPFNLVGAEFLGFLIPVLIGAMIAGRVVRNARRGPGPHPSDDEREVGWEEAAYVAGGIPRLTTAAIARLAAGGMVRPDGDHLVRASTDPRPAEGFGRAEQAVLSHLPVRRSSLKPLFDAVEAKYTPEAERLEAEGFTLPAGRRFGVGAAAFVPVLLVILGFALPRLVMGLANDKPVGFLVATIAGGAVIGLVVAFAGNPRLTRRGEWVLRSLRVRHATGGAKDGGDPGLAVALFGTAVLGGTAAAFLTDWYPRQAAAGSSTGCGSGCGTTAGGCSGGDGGGGGGGCGGGGCGGCGGGGGD